MGVRAAMRPGTAATTLASTSAPTAMSTIESVGTLGAGTAWISSANSGPQDPSQHDAEGNARGPCR